MNRLIKDWLPSFLIILKPNYYRLNYVPSKFVCWSPNFQYLSMWLYLYLIDLKSLVWVILIQSNGCSYKKKKFRHTDRHQGCRHMEKKTMQGHSNKAVVQRERPQEKPTLSAPWSCLGSLPPEQWENTFLLVKPPSMWYFAMAAWAD